MAVDPHRLDAAIHSITTYPTRGDRPPYVEIKPMGYYGSKSITSSWGSGFGPIAFTLKEGSAGTYVPESAKSLLVEAGSGKDLLNKVVIESTAA